MRLLAACAALLASTPAVADYRVAASGRYICGDGSIAAIVEQPYGSFLEHRGREVALSRRLALSGFRYSGGGLDLRGSGLEGAKTLTISGGGRRSLSCRAVPATATPGVATGIVTYPARVALPAGAILVVELRDTARADAAAPLLARTRIRPDGNQVPLHWRLDFDPRRAQPPARLSLSARISDGAGRLMWISDTFTPVPVGAHNEHAAAEIRLVPVRTAPATSSR
ncbi:YbaY family lipoprotein [Sandarakinorhabdus sp. DWP1-3-1]|uniref:YbaY family lipoprotein n=1 Tax=Sandarakinorhabdus sp. DWP1-3-1 TaxID=2804627 RepID=UPI003CF3D2C1